MGFIDPHEFTRAARAALQWESEALEENQKRLDAMTDPKTFLRIVRRGDILALSSLRAGSGDQVWEIVTNIVTDNMDGSGSYHQSSLNFPAQNIVLKSFDSNGDVEYFVAGSPNRNIINLPIQVACPDETASASD